MVEEKEKENENSFIVTLKGECTEQQYKQFRNVIEASPYNGKVTDSIPFIKAYVVNFPIHSNMTSISSHPLVMYVERNGRIQIMYDEQEHKNYL